MKSKKKIEDGAGSNETVWSKFMNQDGEVVYITPNSSSRSVTLKGAVEVIIGNPPHQDNVANRARKDKGFQKKVGKMYDTITDAFTPEPVLSKLLQKLNRCNPDSDLVFLTPRFGKTNLRQFMQAKGYRCKSTKLINGAVCDTYTKK